MLQSSKNSQNFAHKKQFLTGVQKNLLFFKSIDTYLQDQVAIMLRCSLYVHNSHFLLKWMTAPLKSPIQLFFLLRNMEIIGFQELKAFFILLHHHYNLNFKSKHYINFKNKLVRFQEMKLSGPLFLLKDNIQAHKYNQQILDRSCVHRALAIN